MSLLHNAQNALQTTVDTLPDAGTMADIGIGSAIVGFACYYFGYYAPKQQRQEAIEIDEIGLIYKSLANIRRDPGIIVQQAANEVAA